MEGIWNSIKGMFYDEEKGIKWPTIIGIAAGAALGAFFLPTIGIPFLAEAPVVSGVIGAIGGLMVGNLAGGLLGGGGETAGAQPAPGGPKVAQGPAVGQGQDVGGGGPGLPPGARVAANNQRQSGRVG